jgi:hypothetical protein
MRIINWCVVFVVAAVMICSFVMPGTAAENPVRNAPSDPGASPAPGGPDTVSVHKVGTVVYYLESSTGITKHTLDSSNHIDINTGYGLILKAKGKVSGDANKKGILVVYRFDASDGWDRLVNSKLIKPGVWASITTNGILYNTPGTFYLRVAVIAPDGGWSARDIAVHVT